MSRRKFTSDLHLGHLLVARLRGFDTVEEHDAAIIESWQKSITKRDVVYVLGDISSGGGELRALEIIESLPGKKHLFAGNHDSCHPLHVNGPARQRRFLDAFDSVQPFGLVKLHSVYVAMSHFPYEHQERDPKREAFYDQWRLRDMGGRLLCGHVHDAWQVRGRQFNVGVDHHMAPWDEHELTDWITTPLVGDHERELLSVLGEGPMSRGRARDMVLQCAGDDKAWLTELTESMNVMTRDMVTGRQVMDELARQQDLTWS